MHTKEDEDTPINLLVSLVLNVLENAALLLDNHVVVFTDMFEA
jgi:hypothetical protein